MYNLPEDFENVEILINQKWIPVTFHKDGKLPWRDTDDIVWENYFIDKKNICTYPLDTSKKGPYPEWRKIQD